MLRPETALAPLLLSWACTPPDATNAHDSSTPAGESSPRNGDTSTTDSGSADSSGDSAGSHDTAAKDTAGSDTAGSDTAESDSGSTDTGGSDTGGTDTGIFPTEPVVDFSLVDLNATSPRYGQPVSPRDYLEQVSGWYFAHAT